MPKRKIQPADYIARRALYLPETARYDWIMEQAEVSGADLPGLVTAAMSAIEAEFEPLLGVLPNDVFGRIYEYFLAKFSMQKAHDNGEFFTPSSIVHAEEGRQRQAPRRARRAAAATDERRNRSMKRRIPGRKGGIGWRGAILIFR